ncbi:MULTISPECIES: YoqO family protein [Bacillus cereus group]|uniref:YoqO family protein n=1 Tax=Bacillus cereus group TaxID=86661 RepID=UPI001114F108|nr:MULTISPECIES: YoqO family protein [Bacillus cereus group]MCU4900665.1 YoqO family protein [Bacillus cereus]MCU5312044.1 YoqO family protein [Bacillus cereus]MCU5442606.1 YoqO family protein [Bacillus cereus]MCU5480080.1 YoqO family protein [Bacillus cereus]HDR4602535.1 permease [Bacillus cereus]
MARLKNGCYNTINPKNGIKGGLMRKKIGFWGFIISCSLLIILKLFTNNEWISIIPVFGFVFILLYNWDGMKQYSKKSIGIMIGIIVVYSIFVGFILIEGQKQMEKMSIFQEWMSSAKGLYFVIVVVIFLRIVISIVSYIVKEK